MPLWSSNTTEPAPPPPTPLVGPAGGRETNKEAGKTAKDKEITDERKGNGQEHRRADSGHKRSRGKPPPQGLTLAGNDAALSRKLHELHAELKPPADEVKRLEECMMGMSNLVKTLWPHAKLHPFGSCISNFAMRNSDVDFCLVMPTWPDGTECDKSEVVERLSEYLEKAGMLKVTALPNARVPIVKLTEARSMVACDVCVNNLLPLANTKLLRDYSRVDPRVAQLVYIVKHWARQRDLNNTYHGTLSSYAYVLMCIHLLQTRNPPVVPCLQKLKPPTYQFNVHGKQCSYYDRIERLEAEHGFHSSHNQESLASLLFAFFDYWAWRHDYSNQVVSIRNGGCVSKAAKDWTRRVGNERHLICIEDPFDVSHDLGRVVDHRSIGVLRDEFVRAAKLLREHQDPYTKLFAKHVEESRK